MKRILITGGAGFIGSHCVDLFISSGYAVGVFDIKKEKDAINLRHHNGTTTYIEGDIRIKRDLDTIMSYYDVVLHLAADVSVQKSFEDPEDTHKTNVDGTLNVLASAAENGIQKVVYASSAAVYGDTEIVPTHENVALSPSSPYGVHKCINELYGRLYSQQFSLPTVGLRFFNVYGSRQDPSSPYSGVVSIFYDYLKQQKSPFIYGDGSATRDFIHVHDIAKVCLFAIENEKCSNVICNVGTGEATSIIQLFNTIKKNLSCSINPEYKRQRNGDILHSCADISLLQKKMQFTPSITLQKGVEEMLENT